LRRDLLAAFDGALQVAVIQYAVVADQAEVKVKEGGFDFPVLITVDRRKSAFIARAKSSRLIFNF